MIEGASLRARPRLPMVTAICLVAVCGAALFMAQGSAAADLRAAGSASAQMELKGSDGSLISIRASEGQVSVTVTVSPRALRLQNQVRSEYSVSGSTSGEAVSGQLWALWRNLCSLRAVWGSQNQDCGAAPWL
jgi:hypothetical protein